MDGWIPEELLDLDDSDGWKTVELDAVKSIWGLSSSPQDVGVSDLHGVSHEVLIEDSQMPCGSRCIGVSQLNRVSDEEAQMFSQNPSRRLMCESNCVTLS